MLADPISITQSAVAYNFVRTGMSANGAQYRTSNGLRDLSIAHSLTGKGSNTRARHEVRLNFADVGADPFVGDLNRRYEGSLYLVANLPSPLAATSFATADINAEFDKLTKILGSASSWDIFDRVIQGES